MGNSYALHLHLKVYSDIHKRGTGAPSPPPEDIRLTFVDGSIGTYAQSGTLETVFTTIGPDFTTLGWGHDSSDVQLNSIMEVKSVTHAKNEDYSFLNLISGPLTGQQIKALDGKIAGNELRLFILLNFYFYFDSERDVSYRNTMTLRSNYNTNQFYFAINLQDWARIKGQMGLQ